MRFLVLGNRETIQADRVRRLIEILPLNAVLMLNLTDPNLTAVTAQKVALERGIKMEILRIADEFDTCGDRRDMHRAANAQLMADSTVLIMFWSGHDWILEDLKDKAQAAKHPFWDIRSEADLEEMLARFAVQFAKIKKLEEAAQ